MSNSMTTRTVTNQAPLSIGFSRQDYWSGLPCPSQRDLPDPGIEPPLISPALVGGLLTTSATGEAHISYFLSIISGIMGHNDFR